MVKSALTEAQNLLESGRIAPYITVNTAGPGTLRCVRAGFFMSGGPRLASTYPKPFLSIPEQIERLVERGLDVGDLATAEALLRRYGYYRLSGYWHPLRRAEFDVSSAKVVYHEAFKQGATLTQAMALADFDRKLRSHFLLAIERIEVAMRVRLALLMGPRHPLAHRDPSQFHAKFTTPDPATSRSRRDNWLARVDENEMRSKEQFAKHIRSKYGLPFPLWVSIEVWDFGMLSQGIGGMTVADQKALSNPFGLTRTGVFPSWLRAINHVRNVCAHHSRLWNKSPADQPIPPKQGEIPLLDHLATDTFAHVRLYSVAAAMQFLLRGIDPAAAMAWSDDLKAHFATFPAIVGLSVGATGFPTAWEGKALWN
jgi:abortive infection bacteriophage resistance protein